MTEYFLAILVGILIAAIIQFYSTKILITKVKPIIQYISLIFF